MRRSLAGRPLRSPRPSHLTKDGTKQHNESGSGLLFNGSNPLLGIGGRDGICRASFFSIGGRRIIFVIHDGPGGPCR